MMIYCSYYQRAPADGSIAPGTLCAFMLLSLLSSCCPKRMMEKKKLQAVNPEPWHVFLSIRLNILPSGSGIRTTESLSWAEWFLIVTEKKDRECVRQKGRRGESVTLSLEHRASCQSASSHGGPHSRTTASLRKPVTCPLVWRTSTRCVS